MMVMQVMNESMMDILLKHIHKWWSFSSQ